MVDRFFAAYHKAHRHYRDIEACPVEERGEAWQTRYELVMGLMRKLRGWLLTMLT